MMRSIREIAREIAREWKKPYFGAVPYLQAMMQLDSITDMYGYDDAKSVVLYFLSNATTWRGDVARRIKKELNDMLKGKSSLAGFERTINDEDRRQWVENDEGLYDAKRMSRLSMREFIRQNREWIDSVIETVTTGKKPAHYLKYDPSLSGFVDDVPEDMITRMMQVIKSRNSLTREHTIGIRTTETDELYRLAVLGEQRKFHGANDGSPEAEAWYSTRPRRGLMAGLLQSMETNGLIEFISRWGYYWIIPTGYPRKPEEVVPFEHTDLRMY